MERLTGADSPGAWRTFTGCWSTGSDAAGAPVDGTPRSPNSLACTEPTNTPTPTPTPSPTPTPLVELTPASPQSILIHEVAWSGTIADANDEWIELHNPGASTMDLSGWRLTDNGDLHILLNGTLSPYGLYLLERTSDQR